MDRESYDLASDDEIVDEFYTYFPQSHKLIVRNIKAKTLLIEESSDNRIHITIYGFIKRDLPSIHKSGMNGFVHVEGDLIPNGLYSQTLGTGVWSIHSLIPNLRVLPPKLQCDKIVINVPPKCRTILSWIEVHSFRTRVRLDDARIHCVRSMGMMKFSDLISPTVVLDGNTQMEIAHIGGELQSDPLF